MKKLIAIVISLIFIFEGTGYCLRVPLNTSTLREYDIVNKHASEAFINYLKFYGGSALSMEDFIKDIKNELPSLFSNVKGLEEGYILNLLRLPAVIAAREYFSPSTIRFVASLRAKGILENWKEGTKNTPVLGNIYFENEIFPGEANTQFGLLPFYHPDTDQRYYLFIVPQEDDPTKAVFRLYSEFLTGRVFVGLTIGRFGTSDIKVIGDVPSELKRFLVFLQSHIRQGCRYYTVGASLNRDGDTTAKTFCFWARKESYVADSEQIHITISSDSFRAEHDNQTDTAIFKLRINSPKRSLKAMPSVSFTRQEKDLLWRNKWDSWEVQRDWQMKEVLERLDREGKIGRNILELGGNKDSVSVRLFKDKRIVSFDKGVPAEVMAEMNKLFIQGDVENMPGISEAALREIATFLEVSYTQIQKNWLSAFRIVIISSLLAYVDGMLVVNSLAEGLEPGSLVIVVNDVKSGFKEAFSQKGIKSNRELLELFPAELFELEEIYGYKFSNREKGGNFLSEPLYPENNQLTRLSYEEAIGFDGVLYLILERHKAVSPLGTIVKSSDDDRSL